jgi:Fe-S cluster biosynthesis and repair protein YggX
MIQYTLNIRRLHVTRTVYCAKLKQELPGLKSPPYPGELGQRVYENVSQQGWNMWLQQMTLLINHYGLNLADPRATEILREEMEEFFFGQEARTPEDWTPSAEGAS